MQMVWSPAAHSALVYVMDRDCISQMHSAVQNLFVQFGEVVEHFPNVLEQSTLVNINLKNALLDPVFQQVLHIILLCS